MRRSTTKGQPNSSDQDAQKYVEQAVDDYNNRRHEVLVGDQPVPVWADKEQLYTLMKVPLDVNTKHVSYRQSDIAALQTATRDVHLTMRSNYADFMYHVGRNIFPVIVAADESDDGGFLHGIGTMFTLYLEDGSVLRTSKPSPFYEIYKNMSHMPLGIFIIISPYFLQPSKGWETKLRNVQQLTAAALAAIPSKEVMQHSEAPTHYLATQMLTLTNNFLNKCLDEDKVSQEAFMAYTQTMLPLITVCMEQSSDIQMESAFRQIKAWKEGVLKDKWDDVFVVIPTVWPVNGDNPRQKVFQQLMTPAQYKTHVLTSEYPRTTEEIFTLIGRVVGDRAAAMMIFGGHTPATRGMIGALSTPRDLVSDASDDSVKKLLGVDTLYDHEQDAKTLVTLLRQRMFDDKYGGHVTEAMKLVADAVEKEIPNTSPHSCPYAPK